MVEDYIMESKKVNIILIVISIVLGGVFIGCFTYSFFNPNFSFVNTISSISSFFVAILTVVYVYTTSKQMDYMRQQLNQMQNDHRMSEQPIIDFETLQFELERPRLFYTPPEDKYSYSSRYYLTLKIRNASTYPALFVDISAELLIKEKNQELSIGAVSRRVNLVAANTTSDSIGILFTADNNKLLSSLRSYTTSGLPKLHIKACYKSLSGANYLLEHTYLLDVSEDDIDNFEILKNWHTTIVAAPIEEKETLTLLKNSQSKTTRQTLFDDAKKRFDQKLLGNNSLPVNLVEIPQNFMLKNISDNEYVEEMNSHQYGRYIGKHIGSTECMTNTNL